MNIADQAAAYKTHTKHTHSFKSFRTLCAHWNSHSMMMKSFIVIKKKTVAMTLAYTSVVYAEILHLWGRDAYAQSHCTCTHLHVPYASTCTIHTCTRSCILHTEKEYVVTIHHFISLHYYSPFARLLLVIL